MSESFEQPLAFHRHCIAELEEERGPLLFPATVDLVALPHILLSVLVTTLEESERAARRYASFDRVLEDPDEDDTDD